MSDWKIEINTDVIGEELLHGTEIEEVLMDIGQNIASRCGDGYECSVHDSGQRSIVNVYPATKEAAQDNYQNNTLFGAL